MQFRADIQGLRALAIIVVFIFHLNPQWLPGGFIGVDLFFVISGYLITTIIINQKRQNTFSFLSFYEKRIKRIAPAYYVLLIFVTIAGLFVYLNLDITSLKKSIWSSALFDSNVFFARGESYFDAKLSENPLLHTWSLSVEMQFYIFLPIILYFIKDKFLPAVILLTIIVLTSYGAYEMLINNKTDAYFSFIFRVPEFLIGAFYSLKFEKGVSCSRIQKNVLALFSLLVLLGCCFLINETYAFPGFWALIPCISIANLLVLDNTVTSAFLSKKTFVYTGELSYSFYLWHWPIIAFLRYYNNEYYFNFFEILGIIFLTTLLSWISYTLIEVPFRKKNSKSSIKALIPLMATVFLFSILLPVVSQKLNKIPLKYSGPIFGLNSHNKNTIERFGDKAAKNQPVFFIGDSHALVIKPFLDYIGKRNNFVFTTLTSDAYPAIEGLNEHEIPKSELAFFRNSQKLVTETEENIAKSNIIIINSVGFERCPSLSAALRNLAGRLKSNQKLVLLNTFPVLDKNPIKTERNFIKTSPIKFKVIENQTNQKILENIAGSYKNVYLYDLSKSRIFSKSPFYKDTLIYYNGGHLNIYGSISLAKDLEKDFMKFFTPLLQQNNPQRAAIN